MPAPQRQRRVLLLTNSEYGQANTFIALTYALAILPNVHIHFGSFTDCAARIVKLRDTLTANGTLGAGSAITFHDIGGPSMEQAIGPQVQAASFVHPPGFFGAIKSYQIMSQAVLSWNGEQYVAGVDGCVRIINEVDPHIIAVDNLLNQGYDACIKLERKHLATGPFSLKDICVYEQSRFVLNYPACVSVSLLYPPSDPLTHRSSSGYPFPLPWSKVLPNIALTAYGIYNFVASPDIRAINGARKSAGLDGPLPLFRGFRKDIEYLAAMIPELDLPLPNLPSSITLCGPFILPLPYTVEETDPELAQWLRTGKGRTVLVNLGTHIDSNPTMAEHLAKGISAAIQYERDQGREIQVLWKLKLCAGTGDVDAMLQTELGNEIQAGRVRVVDWLTVDPLALLVEGNVMCSVHHGGANSFFESTT